MLVILICFTLSKRAKCKELRWCQSYCNLCKYWPFSPHVSWVSMNKINGWTKNLSAIQSFFNGFICLRLFIPWVFILILPLVITPLSCDTHFFPQLWILLFHSTKISAVLLNWRRSRFTFLHEKEGTSLELLFNKKNLPFSIKKILDVKLPFF